MAKQYVPVEISNFVGGLVTDASPLTFPENGSLDEVNMVLNTNGSRRRRLGMDYEDSSSEITTAITYNPTNTYGHTTFRWDNAGGDPSSSLLVVQFGNEIKFFNLNNIIISSEVVATHLFSGSTSEDLYSYAVVDGILVVVTGEKEVTSFEYNVSTNVITNSTNILKVRDLFGVGDFDGVDDLFDGNNITTRPSTKTDEHIYNLRNQSWAEPRRAGNTEVSQDPISYFQTTASKYPSNSDAVTKALYPDANDSDNRTIDRFFADDLANNKFGSAPAPRGHYIIDALERGLSREAAFQQTIDSTSVTMVDITSLPVDRTEGGASVVAQYAGRAWFAGFNGELTSGDGRSPRMSSYILFSRRVENTSDVVRCYQDGDPTSIEEPELINTDGGFIRIDAAYGIVDLLPIGDALFVIANNGVWSVRGDQDSGFTATSYSVTKITDRGCTGVKSVVEVEGSFVYWADDGIYSVARNQYGDWEANSLTSNKVQDLYVDISNESVLAVQGHYDGYDKKIRWIYDNELDGTMNVKELVLDKALGSFSINEIYTPVGSDLPKITGIFESNPFKVSPSEESIVVGGVGVVASTVPVVATVNSVLSTTRQIQYVAVTNLDTVIKYTFSFYKDEDWLDWYTYDSTGVDAAAYLITGYLSGGDFQRQKGIQTLTVYANKTEDGFEVDVNGDFSPTKQSSIKVQSQWEWTNNVLSNRWGREFQAYRHRRLYIPTSVNDTYDDGYTVVTSKNKMRGKGRVLSLKFSTEPGKDFQLLGWSMVMGISTNV
jgi:hypothetical protein